MSGRHVIHRQVFAFDIPDEQSYPGFARRISELQSSSLFEEMDRLLTELIPDDLYIRIDRIEVDVGVIDPDELGQTLIRRVLEALRRQLSSHYRGPSASYTADADPGTRDRRLLEHFVHHGRLPWWAPSQATSIRQVAARLLRGDLRSLRPLLVSLRHDPVKLRRWLGHVDTRDLVHAWKSVHPAWAALPDTDAVRRVEAAIRLSAHTLGREDARDAVRYILLSDILETEASEKAPGTLAPDPRNPLSLLRKATPYTGLSDVSRRFLALHPREGSRSIPPPIHKPAGSAHPPPQSSFPEMAGTSPPVARDPDPRANHSEDIGEFRSFLRTGHLERYRSGSMLTEIVRLFRGLVIQELPSLQDAILDLGRSERVRRRILDNLSSPHIRFFFERAVPDKKELLDWVSNVYLETQRKMRPINQTDIRVKRSVDEITLEIYTSTDLNAITNEAFLRLHLRRMALKHHIRYEDLLRRIVESVAMPPLPLSSRFIDLLRRIYTADILGVADTAMAPAPKSSQGEVDDATLREAYRSSEDLADQQILRTRLQTLARRKAIPYTRLLAAVSASLDQPPVSVSNEVLALLRRVIDQDGPGMTAPGDGAPVRRGFSLPSAVADIFRLSGGKERIPDLKALRAEIQKSARQQGISYGRFLAAVAATLDRPPMPVSGAFLSRVRRVIAQDLPGSNVETDGAYVADGPSLDTSVADFLRLLDGRGRIPDLKALRAEIQKSARQQGISYGRFLAAVAATLDRPPIPVSAAFLERLRKLVSRDMQGMDAADGASVPGGTSLDTAVADVFRLADDKEAIPDLDILRVRLKTYAKDQGIPYEGLLARISSALDRPPVPAAAILVDRLRKLTAEKAIMRTVAAASGQVLRDLSSESVLLEVLRLPYLSAITQASELRASLRRIAYGKGLGYETLLRRLAARVALGDLQLPARFPALLRELQARDAPDGRRPAPTSPRGSPSAAASVSDDILRQVIASREWAGMGDTASLRRHLHGVAGRMSVPYRDLLSRLMGMPLSESPGQGPLQVSELLGRVYREDFGGREARDLPVGGEGTYPIPGEGREPVEGMPAGDAPALRYVAEPVPDELLRLLTRDVMRMLVLAKGTGIFGKSTRALQDLITAYIRLGGEVPRPDAVSADELRRRLSEYLDLDASFLAYAMAYTARLHPEDGSVRELSALLADTPAPSAGTGRQLTEAEVAALVRHLAEYRVYYDAAHVKSLVLPALKGIRIGRDVFAEVMRLLYDEDAPLVVATLHRILDRSGPLPAGPASDATDEVYRAFIVSALDVRNASFGLNRVFADVRRRLQPDREEPFVLPSRLSEVRMSFVGDTAGQAGRKGARSQGARENAIIRLYNILHLDLLLEDAGPRFFDNIPFSFELLLTRYRRQLLDILHAMRLDPELAHFFAYSDPSRLFEQIRTLYPRTRVERVSRVFGHAVELLQRSRWLNLGREQALSFGMLDSFAHVFSREDTEPVVSDIVLDILRRAAETRLLSRAFLEIFRDPDDTSVLRRLGRRLGRKRLERLLPIVAGPSATRAEAIRQRIRLLRDILPEGPREARERDHYLSLSAILEAGTFPAGHPFEGQALESQGAYLAKMVPSGRVLARLLSDRPPRHPAAVLLGAVETPLLASTVVQRFGVDRTTATRLFAFWSSRAGVGGMPPEVLMREVLLLRPVGEEEKGPASLRRSILTYLTASGILSRWQLLEYLPEEGVGPQPSEARGLSLSALVRDVSSPSGTEEWYEFYFGVLTDATMARSEGYRAVHAWAEYLFRHPAGRTRGRLLALLRDAFLRAREGAGGEAGSRLHTGFLEVLRPFDGLRASDARRVLRDMLDAGVPSEVIVGYIEGRRTRDGGLLSELFQAEAGRLDTAPATVAGRLRGIPTPREVLAGLSRSGGPAGRVLAGLRRWVDARPWTPSETERFEELMPPPAFEALLKSLSPSADLPGIVEAWTEAFRVTGWMPDARKARRGVLGILFAERLWRHRSTSAIHAAILTASGLPRVLREGRMILAAAVPLPGGMPPALWSRLMEIPAGGEDRSAEEVSEAWALTMEPMEMTEAEPPAVGSRSGTGVAADAEAVAFFLETGLVPGLGRVAKTSPEYQSLVRRVASMGVARFLSFRRLHPWHEEAVLEFFPAPLVTQHIFGVLSGQASDPALRDFLQSFAEEAVRTRVRLATLVRFLRLFRTRVGTRPAVGNAAVDGFLAEALRIPGFEALVERVAQTIPVDVVRATRSRFLRRTAREARRRSALPGGRLDDAVWFFLQTGMVRASYGVDTVGQLAERLQERIRAGDGAFRGMLFTRLREVAPRRRVRRLLAGMEEREVYAFIHPSLDRELSELVRMMRQRFGIDVWRAVGARTDRDRIERVLLWWSGTRSRPEAPMRLLRLFMEEATAMFDARQLDRIRRPVPGVLTASERELWTELRALLPDWLDAPPVEDRKLRKPLKEEGGPAMNDPEPAPDPAEGIPVRNGGLVLLWPFLGRLFSRLQLTDGRNFLGDRELSRAIRLTEYLVTGRTDMEEHQLALNKVLCGAPLDFEVPAELDITPEEADLGMKMLQGAIRNWEKLKTTKPETFRESFLRREAILYRVDTRWELVVQRKPYDMLLDTLPWNISMIQLSWMPDRLVVQWK